MLNNICYLTPETRLYNSDIFVMLQYSCYITKKICHMAHPALPKY